MQNSERVATSASSDKEKGKTLREELRNKPQLVALESYMAESPWTLERTARDVWQNFFDSNNYTADGITVETKKEDDGTLTLQMKGAASYPFNRLLYFGSGAKEDRNRSTGGKHEGTKIMALSFLRDYGCREVIFGSEDWEISFSLDEPPMGAIDEKMEQQRALYLKLKDKPRESGNYVRIVGASDKVGEELTRAKDLFFHSNNPDTAHPDIDNDKAGMRFHYGSDGNFYLNGQRINFDKRNEWNTLPHFTFWSRQTPETAGTKINLNRDRDLVTYEELTSVYLPFLVDSMTADERKIIFSLLEPFYKEPKEKYMYEYDPKERIGNSLLRKLVDRLAKENFRPDFPNTFLANDVSDTVKERLEGLGFTMCKSYLAHLGMRSAEEEEQNHRELTEVEPTMDEERRIILSMGLIRDFIREARGNPLSSPKVRRLEPKDVKLFTQEHPNLHGKYEGDSVWISRHTLRNNDAAEMLGTLIHEHCHIFGSDGSPEFSDAVTDALVAWTRYISKRPQEISELEKKWQKIKFNQSWESVRDMEADAAPIISEAQADDLPWRTEGIGSAKSVVTSVKSSLKEILKHPDLANIHFVELIKKIKATAKSNPAFLAYEKILNAPDKRIAGGEENPKEEREALAEKILKIYTEERDISGKIKAIDESITTRGGKRESALARAGIVPLREKLLSLRQKRALAEEELARFDEDHPRADDLENAFMKMARSGIFGVKTNMLNLTDINILAPAMLQIMRDDGVVPDELAKVIELWVSYDYADEASPYAASFRRPSVIQEFKEAVEAAKKDPSKDNLGYARMLYEAVLKS